MKTPLGLLFPIGLALLTSACGGNTASTGDGSGAPAPGANASRDPALDPAPPTMTSPAFCAGNPNDEEMTRRIFDALTPAPAADYLALRRLEVSVPNTRDGEARVVTLAERGTMCASASDRAACAKSYGRLNADAPWWPIVFFTRGDEVEMVRTSAEALSLVGSVDSPEDAFFVARQAGLHYSCGGANATGYRVTNEGFEIVTETGGCGRPVERVVVLVRTRGALEEISRVTTEAETSACAQP